VVLSLTLTVPGLDVATCKPCVGLQACELFGPQHSTTFGHFARFVRHLSLSSRSLIHSLNFNSPNSNQYMLNLAYRLERHVVLLLLPLIHHKGIFQHSTGTSNVQELN
jgi:hypothetical protein